MRIRTRTALWVLLSLVVLGVNAGFLKKLGKAIAKPFKSPKSSVSHTSEVVPLNAVRWCRCFTSACVTATCCANTNCVPMMPSQKALVLQTSSYSDTFTSLQVDSVEQLAVKVAIFQSDMKQEIVAMSAFLCRPGLSRLVWSSPLLN